MNRKKAIVLGCSLGGAAAVVLAVILLTVFVFVPNARAKTYFSNYFEQSYDAGYREFFQLPRNSIEGRGVTYEVRVDGKRVETFNGGFLVERLGTYRVKAKVAGRGSFSFRVNSSDLTAPQIDAGRDYVTVLTGSAADLPVPVLTDNLDEAEQISLSYAVNRDGQSVAFADGCFTPETDGKYEVIVTATDRAGNAASARVTYSAVSDPAKLHKLFYFDEPEGTNCIRDFIGGSASYNSDAQFVREGEAGSLKISFDGSHINPRFAFNAPLLSLEGATAFTFWVYNDSQNDIGMALNMGRAGFHFPAGAWTQVRVTADQIPENSDDPNYELADISGMQSFFYSTPSDQELLQNKGTLYFSAAYAEF